MKTTFGLLTKMLKQLRRAGATPAIAGVMIGIFSSNGPAQSIKARRPDNTRPANPQTASRSVVINAVQLDNSTLNALEQLEQMRIPNGRYWYDRACGAWGIEGGPARGFVVAGLNLGGPLRADASRGHTGVFINGRELHALDVAALRQLGPVQTGRYWLDAFGNVGHEGGPALVNLVEAARAVSGATARHTSRGRRGSAFTTWDRTGVAVYGW